MLFCDVLMEVNRLTRSPQVRTDAPTISGCSERSSQRLRMPGACIRASQCPFARGPDILPRVSPTEPYAPRPQSARFVTSDNHERPP